MSEASINFILEYVVGECYLREKTFSLHLNLVFIVIMLSHNGQNLVGVCTAAKFLSDFIKKLPSYRALDQSKS